MITKLLSTLKKWALPIVVLYTIGITIGSLVHIGGIPNLNSGFDDKIFHFIAYTVFTILVYNYCSTIQITSAILISAVIVIIYGIIIEALQYGLTSYRTFDIFDALANALGVCFAAMMLKIRNKLKLK